MIKIESAIYQRDYVGYSELHVVINGRVGVITYVQKFIKYDAVWVDGPAGVGFSFTLPADPDDGRPFPQECERVIQDHDLAELFRQYKYDLDHDSFVEGKRLV
jgi:hypothetical protein